MGLAGVVEDDNVAIGIFIGTSLTTAVCMGQKCVTNSRTGAQIKCKKGGKKKKSTAKHMFFFQNTPWTMSFQCGCNV